MKYSCLYGNKINGVMTVRLQSPLTESLSYRIVQRVTDFVAKLHQYILNLNLIFSGVIIEGPIDRQSSASDPEKEGGNKAKAVGK